MILKKLQLEYVPFEQYAHLKEKESLAAQAGTDQLHHMESWLMPQILAHYGKYKIVAAEGQIDIKSTLKLNMQDNPWEVGLWRCVTKMSRGELVQSQSKTGSAQYSRLVPLILAGVKQYQDIPYTAWPKEHIHLVVDDLMAEAMCAEYEPFVNDELLQARTLGLTIKSGAKHGEQKSATTTWKLTGLQQLRVGSLPILAQTMLCQVWVAHPSLRTKYMILNPKDWDNMPTPLISSEVVNIVEPVVTHKNIEDNRLPWEM
jgi:hypothetical protein